MFKTSLQNIWVTKPNSSEKRCSQYKIQGYQNTQIGHDFIYLVVYMQFSLFISSFHKLIIQSHHSAHVQK